MPTPADIPVEHAVEAPSAAAGRFSRWSWAGWLVLFLVCATLNAGGYRYGASDQAFYIPAVLRHLDQHLFPGDWALLGPQDQLNGFTGGVAAASSLTGVPVPWLFFVLYLCGLAALFHAAVGIGSRLSRSAWTVVALAFACTLRHAVALGAVNTLEGYMHPRMLAFAVGSMALAAYLAGRPARAAWLVVLAGLLHPTTAIWFALWLAVSLAVSDRRFRLPVVAAAAAAGGGAAWALLAGPLAGRLVPMDAPWLAVLASKRYLFPTSWPVDAWLLAAAYPIVIGTLFAVRRRRGVLADREPGLVAGAAVLFAVFLASVPLTAAHLAIAVQLQVPRVLWLLDLVAVAYACWYLAEGAPWTRKGWRRARTAALVVLVIALSRGVYVMAVEHRDRAVVRVDLPANDWTATLGWIAANTPKDAWVLAPPGHAWRYGTSVRVGAARDVYLEEAKDTAMAMYSRRAALTVADRIRRASGFEQLTAEGALAFATDTGVNLLVTEHTLALPLLHEEGRFRVYRLR